MATKKQLKKYYQDLAEKMDYEGGIHSYFVGYGFEEGLDEELNVEAEHFIEVCNAFESFLQSKFQEHKVDY